MPRKKSDLHEDQGTLVPSFLQKARLMRNIFKYRHRLPVDKDNPSRRLVHLPPMLKTCSTISWVYIADEEDGKLRVSPRFRAKHVDLEKELFGRPDFFFERDRVFDDDDDSILTEFHTCPNLTQLHKDIIERARTEIFLPFLKKYANFDAIGSPRSLEDSREIIDKHFSRMDAEYMGEGDSSHIIVNSFTIICGPSSDNIAVKPYIIKAKLMESMSSVCTPPGYSSNGMKIDVDIPACREVK